MMAAEGKSDQKHVGDGGCPNEAPRNHRDSPFCVPGWCPRLHGGEPATNYDCNAGRTWTRESRVHPRATRHRKRKVARDEITSSGSGRRPGIRKSLTEPLQAAGLNLFAL